MAELRYADKIYATSTKIPGFCGGGTCWSEAISLEAELSKETAMALLIKFLKTTTIYPVMFFPDCVGGRWDKIFSLIKDEPVVFEKNACTYYYKQEKGLVGEVVSWTSGNSVRTYVLVGEAVPTKAAWMKFKQWYTDQRMSCPYSFAEWQLKHTGLLLSQLVAREKERGRELYDYS